MAKAKIITEGQAAFNKVFGEANTGAFSRTNMTQPMRVGKTARDKAKGHIPYQKNRRVWEETGSGKNKMGQWVKA